MKFAGRLMWMVLAMTAPVCASAAGEVWIVEHPSFPELKGAERAAGIAGVQEQLVPQLEKQSGLKVRYRFQTIPFLIVEGEPEALERLKAGGEVVGVAADVALQPLTAESAPAIGADYVQDTLGRNGAGVAVGLIDSGLDLTHPDLDDALIAGRRQLGADTGSNVQDDLGHGTYLAGIVTADGGLAPRGIAPGAGIVMVKAINAAGALQLSDAAAGIDWIVANHASFPSLKFINLSFGFVPANTCPCYNIGQPAPQGDAFTVLRAAIDAAEGAGILCVAAAGNNGFGANPGPPACFDNVISVGAGYDSFFARAPATGTYFDQTQNQYPNCYDEDAALNSITCFSSRAGCLDFIAPGYLITSSDLMTRGGVIATFGTSAAAAHVTAALALLQQINPNLSAAELVELLRDNAQPVEDPEDAGVFYDRVDAREAATALLRSAVPHWTVFE